MTLTQIFIFVVLGLLAGRFYKLISRSWLLFVASALAVFWLQPAALVRNFDFYLPLLSLALAAFVWALTVSKEYKPSRQDGVAAALLTGLALLISATRYVELLCCVTASRPPQIELVAILVLALAALGWAAVRFGRGRSWLLNVATLFILGVLIVLKAPALALRANGFLRGLSGQDAALASPLDIGWLGFSYIAFRLVHALRDRLAGRLPAVSLRDFVTYIIFFPALTAGPIERIERFAPQLEKSFQLDNDALLAAGRRLFAGLFLKFVLADALAIFALNATNAQQTQTSGWMWALLFAYSFRIFFDFAGYTSIAIGLGLLFGVLLPENFERPYLKPNITAFWNSWHITLAQWFRSYLFNPLTRALRSRNWPVWSVVLVGQLSTMALIGLWHGITLNFLTWGLWHGAGLFLHNQWTQFVKARQITFPTYLSPLSTLSTFLFVSLGWVWFALPQPADALRVLSVLFGVGS